MLQLVRTTHSYSYLLQRLEQVMCFSNASARFPLNVQKFGRSFGCLKPRHLPGASLEPALQALISSFWQHLLTPWWG